MVDRSFNLHHPDVPVVAPTESSRQTPDKKIASRTKSDDKLRYIYNKIKQV